MATVTGSDPAAIIGAGYGNDYLNWKNWGDSTFGALTRSQRSYFRAEVRRSGVAFPEGSNVLEIGFGNGSFLTFARQQKWNVVGTEVNAELIGAAKAARFSVAHTDNLSEFRDGSFELITAFDVLEHIAQDQIAEFILEIKRILKPGGVFIARCPNGDSPFGLVNQNGDVTHVTVIGRGKARYFAAKTGMELVYLGGEAEPILGTSALDMAIRAIGVPVKKAIDACLNVFVYQSKVAFCSRNLTLIFRKPAKGQ
jgi:2-polyprenyl-3-methyl-5-hydroxy-6-metoxy-1,4-benzoquinol methylase